MLTENKTKYPQVTVQTLAVQNILFQPLLTSKTTEKAADQISKNDLKPGTASYEEKLNK